MHMVRRGYFSFPSLSFFAFARWAASCMRFTLVFMAVCLRER